MPKPLRRCLALLTAFLLLVPFAPTQAPAPAKQKDAAEVEKWVAETLRGMSLEEKVGQLLLVYYFGGFTSSESEEYKSLIEQIERRHVGGFVVRTRGTALGFERSQVYPTAVLANQLQRRAKLPLLVAADFERGTAMRLVEGTSFPQAMGAAATWDARDASSMGRITALEARAAGVHWIFAPVADVNINPDNPIINVRSFGEDPERVAELVAAFVRGVEENGALATAKHFPGHGDTSVDSHVDLPTVRGDRGRLDRVELPPFRAAIAAGVSTIMTGHLAVPALEPDPDVPATLSPNVLTALLRTEMGFDGIIVTDALDMGGVTSRYPPAEVAVRAIAAGADVLLVPPIPDAARQALLDAAETGRLPMARIDEAVSRVLRAKARLGLDRERLVDVDGLNQTFGRPEFVQQAQDIADRGVTLLRDTARLVPLDATRRTRALLVSVAGDPDPVPGEDFEREIRWRVDALQVVRTDTRFSRAETLKLPPPDSYDVAIAALYVRVADRKGTVGLPENQAALVNELLATGKPVAVVSFGNPYLIERFPAAKTWLAVFSTVDTAQRAAARALFGQVAIGGRIPVSVPGAAKLGDGLNVAANPMKLHAASAEFNARLKPVYEILERAVADHGFPGGVLAVGYRGELAMHAFGRQTFDANSSAITPDTIYHLASVTKPVVTATLTAMLVEQGRVQLDAPVSRYVPEWASGAQPEWRRKVTVRHLLTHTSGLPFSLDFSQPPKDRQEILSRICAEPLAFEPGTAFQYSSTGFVLLGEIIERMTGRLLDVLASERIFAPLRMNDTMYNPPPDLRDRIAPAGTTASLPAWAMGTSGLFSTALDLAAFCQMLLNGGLYAHQRLLRRNTLDIFTTAPSAVRPAGPLGWLRPNELLPSGRLLSPRSFWHLGSSGASIAVDPERGLFIILLTNSERRSLQEEKGDEIRAAVHDGVCEALGLVLPK